MTPGFYGVCALVALIKLDDVYTGQFALARPIVLGTICGVVSGDIPLGLQLGLWVEFILLDHTPVGGVIPPSGAITTASAFLIAHNFGVAHPFAFIVALIIGKIYTYIEAKIRHMRSEWNSLIEADIEKDADSINLWIAKGLAYQFSFNLLYLISATMLLGFIADPIWRALPDAVQRAMSTAYAAIPWMGMAMMLVILRPRQLQLYEQSPKV